MDGQADPAVGHDDDSVMGRTSPPPAAAAIFGARLAEAVRYREILATDGIVQGLMGPREVPRLWDRHILNCAVIGEAIADGETVIDIGSGAGLPGVPLAIARPDLTITLIEPLLRRSNFLESVVEQLGLTSVTVVRGRAEERAVRERVDLGDVVTSRAVAPLERLAKWSAPLIRVDGRLVAIKGSSAGEEIARDRDAVGRYGLARLRTQECGTGVLEQPTTIVVGDRVGVDRRSKGAARKQIGGKRDNRDGRGGPSGRR